MPLKLRPEVELPRPRSNGAALVAVASLAMFTAVGASAFVVRVRMEQLDRAGMLAAPRQDAHVRYILGELERLKVMAQLGNCDEVTGSLAEMRAEAVGWGDRLPETLAPCPAPTGRHMVGPVEVRFEPARRK